MYVCTRAANPVRGMRSIFFFFFFFARKKKRCTIGAPAAAINGACDACRFISRICSSEEVAEIRSSFEEALRKRRLISSETRGAN